MKTIILAVGVIGLMGVAIINQDRIGEIWMNTEEATNERREVEEDQGQSFTDEEAIAAAQAVIHRKALEEELNGLESNFGTLTAQYDADKATYLGEKERLERELGSY